MSLSKADREKYGPGWGEVIFGAVLCILLGVFLTAVHLTFKPVTTITKPDPKLAPDQVTYMEGGTDRYRGQGWMRKRQDFLKGRSISLSEEELNVAVVQAGEKASAPAEKSSTLKQKKKEEPTDGPYIIPGTLNFRIADGLVQVSLPFNIPLLDQTVIVQASGTFVKEKGANEIFEFVPSRFYLGSLPLHRVPGLCEELARRAAASEAIPADMKEAWAKAVDVRVEGRVLHVDLP